MSIMPDKFFGIYYYNCWEKSVKTNEKGLAYDMCSVDEEGGEGSGEWGAGSGRETEEGKGGKRRGREGERRGKERGGRGCRRGQLTFNNGPGIGQHIAGTQ